MSLLSRRPGRCPRPTNVAPTGSSGRPEPVAGRASPAVPAVIAAVLLFVAGGCTKDPAPVPPAAATTPAVTATSEPTRTDSELTVALDADGVSAADKAALKKVVGKLVGGWLDAAYLSGPAGDRPGPRRFPGFTDGAARSAGEHPRQLTNAALGTRAKGLVATARTVSASAYVVDGKAQGVVAEVAMAATGPRAKLTVRGSLDLIRLGGRWQVFGYHITATTP